MCYPQANSYRLQSINGGSLIIALLAMLALVGCSPKNAPQELGKSPHNEPTEEPQDSNGQIADSNLLMLVRFNGTAELIGNASSAYLTNVAAMPETAALRNKLVERFATLTEMLVKRGLASETGEFRQADTENSTHINPSAARRAHSANQLQTMFGDLLRGGFVLELRGNHNGVTSMALAGKADPETTARWNQTMATSAMEWFGEEINSSATRWSAGDGKLHVQSSNGVLALKLSAHRQHFAFESLNLIPEAELLTVKMRSDLLPGPIQRSVYGGFEQFSFSAEPDDGSIRIRGKATYSQDLPPLGPMPEAPTNLVTEPTISFTLVRQLGAWLEASNPLWGFFPDPIPEFAFFWGGQTSPYQLFMAVPYLGNRERFNAEFGPALVKQLTLLSRAIYTGSVPLDPSNATIQWFGHAFITPQLRLVEHETHPYLVAETFPQSSESTGLTPALIERVSMHTNVVLYDWEFTALRFDTWVRIGQLALLYGNYHQLDSSAPSLLWTLATLQALGGKCNTSTEIVQTGPRELTIARRGPIGLTSIELFWLANWLESDNFPSANFLVPKAEKSWGETGQ